jgi:hypothetical protein
VKIKNGKDFWAGLMFLGAGIGFMIVSRNYPMGTAVRMGPAYFPTVLGGLMAVLGAIIFLRAFVSKIHHSVDVFPFRWVMMVAGGVLAGIMYASAGWWASMGKPAQLVQYLLNGVALFLIIASFGPKPLFVILVSVVLFGYLLKPLGLVLATAVLIFVSAWGGHEFKLREVVFLYAALAIFSVGTFIYGLSLPINIWPDLG